jgi:hypothetical protein
MNRRRFYGTMAAIGGFTAALALLSGVPSAKADELSDLQANNQLLQQKVDQLAQFPGVNVGPSRLLSEDERAAVAAAVQGSFPRSFLIPGTDTSLRVGGNITFIVDYMMEGSGTAGGGSATTWNTTLGANGGTGAIPITGGGRSSNLWGESMRQSQLTVETRTPTPYGEARTFMSFDWAQGSDTYVPAGAAAGEISDNLAPRLKYAYGTLGGWLAGQANSNFEDPDANGETLDFGGNVGEPGRVRVAQLRYTMPLTWAWGGALSFSAENPEVEVRTPFGICGSDAAANSACASPGLGNAGAGNVTAADINVLPGKPASPDLTAALYIPQPWGHIDIAGVLRPGLEISDGTFLSRTYVGAGGAVSFDVKPGWFTPKDDIIFHFVAGEGIGGYLNDSTNAALQTNYTHSTTAATGTCAALPAIGPGAGQPASCIVSSMIPEYGGEIGYQHFWSDTLRSNVNYGINQVNGLSIGILGATAAGAEAANHRLQTAHANLIWNPVSFVTIGLEYMWGRRTVVFEPAPNPSSQNMQALIGKFDVAF